MTFDIYGDRAVEAIALIREFARVEYWDYFKGDPERALEAFCVMQDAAEAKSAGRIADLEAQVSALKAAGGVPEGWKLVPIKPTAEMYIASGELYFDTAKSWKRGSTTRDQDAAGFVWHAMVSAAPQVAEQTKQEPK